MKKQYGKELIIDLHECDNRKFNRSNLRKYFRGLCKLIAMERRELFWWDDYGVPADERQTEPHLKGTSAVQFIMTSNITIHTLDKLKSVYVNIFSCKDFNAAKAVRFSHRFFRGTVVTSRVLIRK